MPIPKQAEQQTKLDEAELLFSYMVEVAEATIAVQKAKDRLKAIETTYKKSGLQVPKIKKAVSHVKKELKKTDEERHIQDLVFQIILKSPELQEAIEYTDKVTLKRDDRNQTAKAWDKITERETGEVKDFSPWKPQPKLEDLPEDSLDRYHAESTKEYRETMDEEERKFVEVLESVPYNSPMVRKETARILSPAMTMEKRNVNLADVFDREDEEERKAKLREELRAEVLAEVLAEYGNSKTESKSQPETEETVEVKSEVQETESVEPVTEDKSEDKAEAVQTTTVQSTVETKETVEAVKETKPAFVDPFDIEHERRKAELDRQMQEWLQSDDFKRFKRQVDGLPPEEDELPSNGDLLPNGNVPNPVDLANEINRITELPPELYNRTAPKAPKNPLVPASETKTEPKTETKPEAKHPLIREDLEEMKSKVIDLDGIKIGLGELARMVQENIEGDILTPAARRKVNQAKAREEELKKQEAHVCANAQANDDHTDLGIGDSTSAIAQGDPVDDSSADSTGDTPFLPQSDKSEVTQDDDRPTTNPEIADVSRPGNADERASDESSSPESGSARASDNNRSVNGRERTEPDSESNNQRRTTRGVNGESGDDSTTDDNPEEPNGSTEIEAKSTSDSNSSQKEDSQEEVAEPELVIEGVTVDDTYCINFINSRLPSGQEWDYENDSIYETRIRNTKNIIKFEDENKHIPRDLWPVNFLDMTHYLPPIPIKGMEQGLSHEVIMDEDPTKHLDIKLAYGGWDENRGYAPDSSEYYFKCQDIMDEVFKIKKETKLKYNSVERFDKWVKLYKSVKDGSERRISVLKWFMTWDELGKLYEQKISGAELLHVIRTRLRYWDDEMVAHLTEYRKNWNGQLEAFFPFNPKEDPTIAERYELDTLKVMFNEDNVQEIYKNGVALSRRAWNHAEEKQRAELTGTPVVAVTDIDPELDVKVLPYTVENAKADIAETKALRQTVGKLREFPYYPIVYRGRVITVDDYNSFVQAERDNVIKAYKQKYVDLFLANELPNPQPYTEEEFLSLYDEEQRKEISYTGIKSVKLLEGTVTLKATRDLNLAFPKSFDIDWTIENVTRFYESKISTLTEDMQQRLASAQAKDFQAIPLTYFDKLNASGIMSDKLYAEALNTPRLKAVPAEIYQYQNQGNNGLNGQNTLKK